MKVLWVISQISPDMADIQNMLNALRKIPNMYLFVAGCSNVKYMIHKRYNDIEYFILPIKGKNKRVDTGEAKKVVEKVQPDLIHIEGTEYFISNVFVKMRKNKNIVSLQGILSGYEPYQGGNLPISEMMFSLKNKDFVVGWTLFLRKKFLFDHRIQSENETIRYAQNLMGRTLWDRAHSYKYNTTAPYYECQRLLRDEFYKNQWDPEDYEKYTIFVGNGYSALKGAHIVFKAVAQLKKEFPKIHVNIAGKEPFEAKLGMKSRIGYALYTRKLIKNLGLEDRVTYLGSLDGNQMIQSMLKSNVYVLPSLIENSPNTLGEAMILGVPSISAYTGGVPSMACDEKDILLYRADDSVMLAWQIRRVFIDKEDAKKRAASARERALRTHDITANVNKLLNAYQKIGE